MQVRSIIGGFYSYILLGKIYEPGLIRKILIGLMLTFKVFDFRSYSLQLLL